MRSEIQVSTKSKISEEKILKELEVRYENQVSEDQRKRQIIDVMRKELAESEELVGQLRAEIRKLKRNQTTNK